MSYNEYKSIFNRYEGDKKIKWEGLFLSDTPSTISQERNKNYPGIYVKEEMSELAISRVIEEAFMKNKRVAVQLNISDENNRRFENDIEGRIIGFTDYEVFIGQVGIKFTDIKNIELMDYEHWFD